MTLVAEKIVVVAREFLERLNINDSEEFNEPIFNSKVNDFGWDLSFSAPSLVCEIIWKKAIKGGGMGEWRQLDRLFSPSPISTHANFRGSKMYKTGNMPEIGAMAVWKRGNGWQGNMAIVTDVQTVDNTFDVIEGKIMEGSENRFLKLEEKKAKRMGLPFKSDKMNLIGFIYPPNREIS